MKNLQNLHRKKILIELDSKVTERSQIAGEIAKAINKFKPRKLSGHDKITSERRSLWEQAEWKLLKWKQ